MSREIKFRAWSIPNSTMHYDVYLYPGSMVVDADDNVIGHDGIDVIVMQYTGLKDMNEVEVYEGDILKFTEIDEESVLGVGVTDIAQVKWIDDLAQWRVVFPSGRRTELHCILEVPYFYDQEVIGNVYENPGLIGDNND